MTAPHEYFQRLDWDSNFFGFGVVKITAPDLHEEDFTALIQALRKQGVQLAYWPTAVSVPGRMGGLIERNGGILADVKTTYIRGHNEIPGVEANGHAIIPYHSSMPESDMVHLALQSGVLSRFAVDPRIARRDFENLYTQWILKSISRELADDVLVCYNGEFVEGMVTVGVKNGRGDIGLVAVDERSRGKRLGEALVYAALRWAVANGYRASQVVTQGNNVAACKLYEKCGYSVETVEPFYHIWLNG